MTLHVSLLVHCEFSVSDLSVETGIEVPIGQPNGASGRNAEMTRIHKSDLTGITADASY